MAQDRALVAYRCVDPAHQEPKASHSDTLTIHDGQWAYCAFDVRATDHRWEATGGVTVSELRRMPRAGR